LQPLMKLERVAAERLGAGHAAIGRGLILPEIIATHLTSDAVDDFGDGASTFILLVSWF